MFTKRFDELSNSIDSHFRLFETALDWPNVSTKSSVWKSDSTESEYVVYVAIPGHTKESVVATIDKGHLFINAVAAEEAILTSNHSFKFKLPKDCSTSAESISASIENGILKVVLPKEVEIKKSTEIKIK